MFSIDNFRIDKTTAEHLENNFVLPIGNNVMNTNETNASAVLRSFHNILLLGTVQNTKHEKYGNMENFYSELSSP